MEALHVNEIWRRYHERLLGFVRSKVGSPGWMVPSDGWCQ